MSQENLKQSLEQATDAGANLITQAFVEGAADQAAMLDLIGAQICGQMRDKRQKAIKRLHEKIFVAGRLGRLTSEGDK